MTSFTLSSPWVLFDKQPQAGDIILFCFPYAGGGASIYRGWQGRLPAGITVGRIQLPGREGRFGDPLMTRMGDLVEALWDAMRPWVQSYRFALFGHSMGGIVAAELVYRMAAEGASLPEHLFIAGSRPPHTQTPHPMHRLSSEAFRNALRRDGGTPDEVIDCDDLMDLFEPILRADHGILETWAPQPIRLLAVPITVFAGLNDTIVPHDVVTQWQGYATGDYGRVDLSAGHFFVRTHSDPLIAAVSETLFIVNAESVA